MDFDTFIEEQAKNGLSIDDIVAKFTDSANRALKLQREEEEAKRKAAEEAKRKAEEEAAKQQRRAEDFTCVMDYFMEFLLDYDYITADEYDQFWNSWDEETCAELLAELEYLASAVKTLQNVDFDVILKDFLTSSEKDKIQEISEKSNTDTEWKTIGPVSGASQQIVPIQKDEKNKNKTEEKKDGKVPVIRVKLPKPNDFMDILNEFLGGLK